MPAETKAGLRRLENIAWTMDNLLPLPGTDVRLRLDSLLGIVPLVGDILDVTWNASTRNVALLRLWLATGQQLDRIPYRSTPGMKGQIQTP